MYLQVQLWVRELSGVQYTLEYPAKFSFRDQVDAQQEVAAMPPWYCRECNSSGWLGVKPDDKDVFSRDVNEVYEKFFSNNKNLYFILPGGELSPADLRQQVIILRLFWSIILIRRLSKLWVIKKRVSPYRHCGN